MRNQEGQFTKRVTTFMVAIIFIGIIYILYCYISGIGVYKVVKYSFLTNEKYNEYVANYMTKDIFDSFNYHGAIVEENKPVKKYLKLYMLFSINDFFNKARIWMYYSFEIKNKRNEIVTGSRNVPFVLYLKKEGWHWKIVQKEEAP
jgi:hypothetical protein